MVNSAGAYQVRLCVDGEWKTLLIDDFIPCTQDGRPAFASGGRRQLWAMLIEKAFAKLHGCYEALEGGTTDEALAAVTGYPCERISLRKSEDRKKAIRRWARAGAPEGSGGVSSSAAPAEGDEEFELDVVWTRLLSFRQAGYLATASIGQGGGPGVDAKAAEAMGLLTEHAYSLLQVQLVRGGAARLLQLRNPWGRLAWRGDWSDGSPLWTRELRMALQPKSEE